MAIEKPIHEILTAIENGEYTIPEFQRGYVWNPAQVKAFIRSLYLNYPTGAFLIWKTRTPSKIRGEAKDTNMVYNHLILDGQQRLTTIYTICNEQTPHWYEGVSLRTDLYFNLETEEFQYYKPREMANKREWLHVCRFLKEGGLNPFILKMMELDAEIKDYYQNKLLQLKKLDDIRNYGYYIKEIQETEIEKIVEIFNLVNSSGTTLTESDLAMAIVTSVWPEVKEKFREAQHEYATYNYPFSFGFFIRCLNIITCERARFQDIKNVTREQLIDAWNVLNTGLHYLINVLRENAYVDSLQNFSTVYVLYVLVYYFSKNGNRFSSTEDMNKFLYWMFVAQLFGRYSGSSESYLDRDLNDLKQTNKVDTLIDNLRMFRGSNLKLTADDFYLQGTNSKIFNIFYAALRSQNARDWLDTNLVLYNKNVGVRHQLEKHHVFPKSLLYKGQFNAKKSVDKRLVNEIANMAFITEKSNKEIGSTSPHIYLPKVPQQELQKQFIPVDPHLWDVEHYLDFLSERRRLLSEGINRFLHQYYTSTAYQIIPKDVEHLNWRIEQIELALRDRLCEILEGEAEENPYTEFVQSHIQEKVNRRLDTWIKKNPGEDRQQFLNFRKQLNFFDIQEYKDIICYKSNWGYFEDLFGSKPNVELRFRQLGDLRNTIRHSRDINEIIIKEGEAAISWFGSILKTYRSPVEIGMESTT